MKAIILIGDARKRLAELSDGSVRTCVTSPPYFGLRDYGENDQIGLEESPDAYVAEMVNLFREVRRVLAADGTLWLNLGDSYAGNNSRASNNGRAGFGNERELVVNRGGEGLKPKDLIGIPWRVAFALQEDGWYLRQDIIWAKPNPMPESVRDRCTRSHEYVFLLSKSPRYYYDHEAVKEPLAEATWGRAERASTAKVKYGSPAKPNSKQLANGVDQSHAYAGLATGRSKGYDTETGKRNKRDVWTIATKPFRGAHFAVMPEALVEPCVLAASAEGDTVLDPFTGSGTVAVVSLRHGRKFVGTELNPEYGDIARKRITNDAPLMNEVEIL